MNDLSQLIKMLCAWEVEYTTERVQFVTRITVERTESGFGYDGFVTIFEFDEAGKFRGMGAYE